MSTEVPTHAPQSFSRRDGDDRSAHCRDEVRDTLDTSTRLVDVRSPAEYSGEMIAMAGYEQEGAQRAATSRARHPCRGHRP